MEQKQEFIKPEVKMAFVLTPWCGDGVDWAYQWYCGVCDALVRMEGPELEHQRYHQQWLSLTKMKREVEDKNKRKELGKLITELAGEYPFAASAPLPRLCGCSARMAYGHEAEGKLFLHRDHPETGPQRALAGDFVSDAARGCGYWQDVTGQFVLLDEFSPDPNVFMCLVAETGTKEQPRKHDGQIAMIQHDSRFLVTEEWTQISATGERIDLDNADESAVRLFLLGNGFDSWLVDLTLQRGLKTETLRAMLKARGRPQIQVATTTGTVQLPSWVPPMRIGSVTEARDAVTWRGVQMAA